MNSLYTLCAFAIGAVCAVKLLKQFKTDLGTLLSAAAGIVITASLVSLLVPVIELLESFSRSAGLENYFPILLKSLGIALICTLTAIYAATAESPESLQR